MGLDSVSVLLLWTAIAIYALAFVAYSVDLAMRSGVASAELVDEKRVSRAKQLVAAGGGDPASTSETDEASETTKPPYSKRFVFARIGTSLTVLGFLLHLGAAVTRGLASGYVPWANLYEFIMMGTLLIVLVYLITLTRVDVRFAGAFILGLVVVLLGLSATNFFVEVVPLAVPLQSVWLVIHVFVASLSVALFALAFAMSVLQLMQSRREQKQTGLRFLVTLPTADRLEVLTYRFITIGFVLWTFTLIAGAIWASSAWARYWGWDVKEVWTFIIWVLYAGFIHARATRAA